MIEYYGCSDVVWQLIRLAILGGLIYCPMNFLKGDYVIPLSILVGSLVYWLLMTMFCSIMYATIRCEALGPFDAIFLLDDRKNLSNILASMFIEPLEFDSFKQYLFGKLDKLHKCRSKLVKHYGMYWY